MPHHSAPWILVSTALGACLVGLLSAQPVSSEPQEQAAAAATQADVCSCPAAAACCKNQTVGSCPAECTDQCPKKVAAAAQDTPHGSQQACGAACNAKPAATTRQIVDAADVPSVDLNVSSLLEAIKKRVQINLFEGTLFDELEVNAPPLPWVEATCQGGLPVGHRAPKTFHELSMPPMTAPPMSGFEVPPYLPTPSWTAAPLHDRPVWTMVPPPVADAFPGPQMVVPSVTPWRPTMFVEELAHDGPDRATGARWLRTAAVELDRTANILEQAELFDEADSVRELAQSLRERARHAPATRQARQAHPAAQ
jgi:hypothetical protein